MENGRGKAVLATMAGGTLTASREGGAVVLRDGKGGRVLLSGAEQIVGNGVVHPIDAVLAPGP